MLKRDSESKYTEERKKKKNLKNKSLEVRRLDEWEEKRQGFKKEEKYEG